MNQLFSLVFPDTSVGILTENAVKTGSVSVKKARIPAVDTESPQPNCRILSSHNRISMHTGQSLPLQSCSTSCTIKKAENITKNKTAAASNAAAMCSLFFFSDAFPKISATSITSLNSISRIFTHYNTIVNLPKTHPKLPSVRAEHFFVSHIMCYTDYHKYITIGKGVGDE